MTGKVVFIFRGKNEPETWQFPCSQMKLFNSLRPSDTV